MEKAWICQYLTHNALRFLPAAINTENSELCLGLLNRGLYKPMIFHKCIHETCLHN